MKKIAEDMQQAIDSMKVNMKKPLGRFNPWAWSLQPVHGCNINCWHCPSYRIKKRKFMTKKAWIAAWEIIKKVSPYCRVEMAGMGEPTLHPKLLEFITIAREISPHSQIQVTTNGTMLMKNKITYKQLFDAGLNICYVDMYAPKEKHEALAEKSGYDYFKYYDSSSESINAWKFHNDPNIKFIALSDTPEFWPMKKIKRGGLGTFLNNLDFKRARKYGVRPVENAPLRRCSQPMKYVSVGYDGNYLMCCLDVFQESDAKGNVIEGVDGFKHFWLGEYMQEARQILRSKHRSKHPICARCDLIFSRCDMLFWKKDMLNYYWDGSEYKKMKKMI